MTSKNNMSKYIDKKVFNFFIIIFLVASVSFSFRYANYEPCSEVLFSFDNNEIRAGNVVQFKDISEDAKKWEWDFGDGTEIKGQKEQLHIFEKEGDYKVRLLINNKCERIEMVHVKPKIILLDSTKLPIFSLPESIKVGQRLIVTDETENSSSWEWRFGETANVNAMTKTTEYFYKEPGLKTVSLIVNDDINYISEKKIMVMPSRKVENRVLEFNNEQNSSVLDIPDAPPEELLSIPDAPPEEILELSDTPLSLTDQNLKLKFQKVIVGQMTSQSFSELFCNDRNPLIQANGRSYTYNSFCKDIKGKNIVIENIKFYKNNDMNCITSFNINF